MARPPTKNSFEKNTIKQMKSLGTYRDEFKPIIEIYAGLLFQYHTYAKAHEENDSPILKFLQTTGKKL